MVLVAYGSSSCVPVASSTTVEGDTAVVTFAALAAEAVRTADMGPRESLATVDSSQRPAEVTLTGGEFAEPVTIPVG